MIKMDNTLHKIFGPDGHITEAMLLRYASGQLTPAEQHKVERHTMDCDLCADVLEGFMNVKKKEEIPSIISSLNKRILERAGTGTTTKIIRPNFRPYYSVAAGLVLVLGLGWLFLKQGGDSLVNENVSQDISKEEPAATGVLDSTKVIADSFDAVGGKYEQKSTVIISENLSRNENVQEETVDDKANFGPPPVEEPNSLSFSTKDAEDVPPVMDVPKDANKKGELDELKKEKSDDGSKNSGSGNVVNEKISKLENKTPKSDAPNKPDANADGKKDKDKEYRANEDQYKLSEKEIVLTKKKELQDKKKQTTKNEESSGDNDLKTVPQQTQPQPNNNVGINSTTSNTTISQKDIELTNSLDSVSTKPGYYANGELLYEKKEFGKSAAEFEKILAINPNDQKALYLCGSAYLESNKPDSAIKHFNVILKTATSPYYQDAELGLAKAYIQKKENAKAKAMLEKIIKAGGKNKAKAEEELKTVK